MSLVPKTFDLLCRCLDEGLDYGWNRAHKHTDSPSPQQIKDCLYNAILNEICEKFSIEDREEIVS